MANSNKYVSKLIQI